MMSIENSTIVHSFIAPKARVLIVDDSNVTLKVQQDIMNSFEMQVSTVNSGEKCLELLANNDYDIIFMDVVMPIMDGMQTTMKIRKMKKELFKNIVIVALTANNSSNFSSLYIENGFNDYLEKPIKIFKLHKLLRTYLPKEYIIETKVSNTSIKEISEIKIKNVNTKKAIQNCCGNIENYLSLLSVAYYDGQKKINVIKRFADNKDIENYTIEVHALKTVAALIGDERLSQLSKRHEIAGTNNDIKFISENVNNLLEQYTTLLNNIQTVISSNNTISTGKIKEFNSKELLDIISNIAYSIDNFDLDSSNEYLDKLLQYSLTDKQLEVLDGVKNYLNVFDYDNAYQLITNFKYIINSTFIDTDSQEGNHI